MAAFVSGNGLGLFNSSLGVLGGQGALGNAGTGRSGEQAYVNVANGNLILQRQDELLKSKGADVGVVRTYNSRGQFNDDNHDNWRLGVHKTVMATMGTPNSAGSTVRHIGGDGVELVYTYDAARGVYVNRDGGGSFDTLTYKAAASYTAPPPPPPPQSGMPPPSWTWTPPPPDTWVWTDGTTQATETYDAMTGQLLNSADANGNETTYGYSGMLLTKVTDASGETTYFDYADNHLTGVRTVSAAGATSTRVRYSYDAGNRLASVTVDLSPDDNSITDGKVYITTYTYDGGSTRITGINQADGTQIGFSYTTLNDGSNRITGISQAVAGSTRVTTLAYNLADRQTTVTDPLGNSTVYAYDSLGRLTNLRGPAIAGAAQNVSYSYDADGNVAGQTDALGNVIAYEYDSNGNQTLQRDSAGNTTTRTYGSKNELLTETIYLSTDPDGAGSAQAGQPQTSRYAYDSANRLRFTVSAQGRVTEYRYNAQGQRIANIEYAGNLYDVSGLARNAAISEDTLAAWVGGAGVDKSKSLRTDNGYDFRGHVSSVTRYTKVDSAGAGVADGTQSVTQFVYDQAGQLLKTIAPKGVATTAIANDFVTTYSYDGLGRLLGTTDALGHATLNQYDDAGNKTVTTLANGLATTSTYNQAGELISVLQADGATALGETKYWYDADGRLRMTRDPTGIKRYSLYDAAGRRVADVDGTGSLIEYRYNANNQITRTIRYANPVSAANLASLIDSNGNPANVMLASIRPVAAADDRSSWRLYDAAQRLAKSIDELGYLTEMQYDGASRITAVIRYAAAVDASAISETTTVTDAAVTPAASSAHDRRTRSFYDNDGKVLAVLDGEGYLTENEYDAAGRLVQSIAWAAQTDSAYWGSGTLAQLRPAADAGHDLHNWILYDGQGRVIGRVDGEGYLIETVYDANGNPIQQIRYANRAQLAPAQITRSTLIADLRPAAHAQDRATAWTYTDLNQVATQTDAQGAVTRYTYDSVGNVTATDKALDTSDMRTLQAKYDKQGRLTGELTAEGSAALAALASPTQAQTDAIWAQYGVTHAYDAAGRRISSTDQDGHKTLFYYDADGQLVGRINALGEVIQYSYNALGQLAATTRFGTRIGSDTLATLTGGLVNDAVTSAVTGIANAAQDSTTHYAYSLRGELIGSSDELGNISRTAYNAFGEVQSLTTQLDANHSVTSEYATDRRGLRTQSTEDTLGLLRITQAVYDAFGRVVTRVDGSSNRNAYYYDRLGRTVQTTDALAIGCSTTYDAFGRMLTQTDGNGHTTSTAYDAAARSVTVTSPEGITVTTTRNRHGDTVRVSDGNGNTTSYLYDKNGNLQSSTNDALAITQTRKYDHAGRQIETVDGNGVKTRYAYDAANRLLMRTVDPDGLQLVTTYGYDAKGQAVSVTDPNGVVTQTTYDLKGQALTVAVDPSGLNLRTTYAYDARGKVLTVIEGAGSSHPRVKQYAYDQLGRRVAETADPGGLNLTTRYGFDNNDNLVTKTDASGPVARFAYDAGNRLVYTIDAIGSVVKNDYDDAGNIIAATTYAKAIDLSELPALTVANIEARVHAEATDQVTRTVYDKDNRAVFQIDALNQVVKSAYDGNGNVIQVTHYAAPVALPATITVATIAGALPAMPGDADRIKRYVFDAANRLAYCIDALGYVTQNGYDKDGNIVKTIAYAKATSVTGNPTAAAMQTTVAANADSAHDRVTRNVFDNANRAVYTIDPNGYVQQYAYDALGHVIKTAKYADPVSVDDAASLSSVAALLPSTPPATAVVMQQVYDNAGRLVGSIDGTGIVTRRLYDDAGRLVGIADAYGTSAESRTYRSYDAAGRMVAETRAQGTAEESTTRYGYDARGNVTVHVDSRGVELAEKDSAWALATRKALGYVDTAGNAKKAVALTADERNQLWAMYATNNVFDALGRKTRVIDALGGTTITQYDAFGNAIKVTDPRGNSGLFYFDKLNRVTLQIDPEGYVTQTGYTASGQPANVTQYANRASGTWTTTQAPAVLSAVPSGSAPAAYLVADAARDQLTKLEYDKRDQLTKSTDAEGYAERYTYDGLGNRTSFTNKADGVFTYSYDLRGKLIAETLPVTSANVGGNQVAVVNQYQYDARGNRIKTIEAVGLPEQRITSYEYDAADRQRKKSGEAVSIYQPGTGWVTATPVEQQAYDARGNLTERIDANGNRTVTYFNAANRRVAEVNAAGTLTTWTLDAAGNATAVRIYGDALTLPVDAAAVPTPVTATNYRETRYAFDANNAQVESRIKEVTLGRYDNATGQYKIYTGDIVTSNVYDANGNLVKAVDGNGNATYAYYDRLGQKVLQIDAEGYAIAYRYDLNGSVATETKYANKLDTTTFAALSTTSDAAALTVKLQNNASADDRIIEYVYDRNNRLVQQRALNVKYASVDAGNGALTEATAAATTRFQYNGLGKVTRRIDAKGNQSDIGYDALGRQLQEQGAAFTDFEGTTVRPTTTTAYDGIGNVKSSTRVAKAAADNQVTSYTYDKAGRMTSRQDPEKAVTNYGYDAAGNTTYTSLQRKDADGAVQAADVTIYRYDALNRQVSRQVPAGTSSDTYSTKYSAYGDIVAKGVNGAWQEFADYNAQGKVWRTNSGQGIAKAYVYDANGNATLSVESAGADLKGLTLDQMLAQTDVKPTVTAYDKRNSVIDTIAPKMTFTHENASVHAIQVPVTADPFKDGTLSLTAGGSIGVTVTPILGAKAGIHYDESRVVTEQSFITGFNIALSLPEALSALGGGSFQVDMTATFAAGDKLFESWRSIDFPEETESFTTFFNYGATSYSGDVAVTHHFASEALNYTRGLPPCIYYTQGEYDVDHESGPYAFRTVRSATIQLTISKLVGASNAKRTLATYNVPLRPSGRYISGYVSNGEEASPIYADGGPTSASAGNQEHQLYFKGQPEGSASLKLKYRPAGSSAAYTEVWVPRWQVNGSTIDNRAFAYDWSGLAANTYDYKYEAYDANGKVLNRVAGQFKIAGTNSAILSYQKQNLDPTYKSELRWVLDGTASAGNAIHRRQEVNAFGNVVAEIDGLGRRTDFTYNALGKLTRKLDPETETTLENGFVLRARPETVYYYDALGQAIGTRDANGQMQTQRMVNSVDAGWLMQEYHADGGKKRYAYDVLGNQRVIVDENGAVTRQTFDKNNRLVRIDRPQRTDGTAPYDSYEYDAAGNRIAHTNALNFRERYYYDAQNRIVQATSFEGRITKYGYSYDASITGLPASVAGGWVRKMTDANGRSKEDKTDTFGRLVWHKDLGGHTFTYSYNAAGWQTKQTGSTGQDLVYAYYDNGFIKSITDNVNKSFTKYEYDAEGNRIFEGYTSIIDGAGNREYYEFSDVTYDELNRVKHIHDGTYDIWYEYDAVGNRRRVYSKYHDGVGGNAQVQDYWYKYDAMNRFKVTMGSLSGARATSATDKSVTVQRGSTGVELEYNAAGQRQKAVDSTHTEEYSYSADGYLEDTKINGQLRAKRVNDALGRVATYYEYNTSNTTVTSRTSTYDKDNKLRKEHDNLTGKGTDYTLLADGTLDSTKTYGDTTAVSTYHGYEWWDSAKESAITSTPYNPNAPDWKSGYSHFVYDANGNVKEVRDEADKRSLRYITNGEGLILKRDEFFNNNSLNKFHNFYYLNGHRVGDVGNDGVSREDYAQALARDKTIDRKEAYKRFRPVAVADFDQNYVPINPSYPGMTATSYVVRSGDTLQAIALQVWGDAAMWYLIADANGLTGQEPLTEGMSLAIPNKVTNIHNNSTTFQVYNAGEAMGDTSPTLPAPPPPPPQSDDGCGALGKIFVVIIAIVATVLTAGAGAVLLSGGSLATASLGQLAVAGMGVLGGSFGFAAAAVAGAVGSIVSQGVGIALGVQDKFSWSGVATSAIGAGVGASMGGAISGQGLASTVGRAVASNVITQGMAVATGLQKKFDWRGVAASAVGSAAGYGMDKALPTQGLNPVLRGSAIGLANGGAYALASGQKPNWGAIAAQSFGSTLGNHLAESAANGGFGNALGSSIANANYGGNGQQTEILGSTFADDMAARRAANYWNPLPEGMSSAATFGEDMAQRAAGNYWNPQSAAMTAAQEDADWALANSLSADASGRIGGTAIPSKAYAEKLYGVSSGTDFARGFQGSRERRSVMDDPSTANTLGRISGLVTDSFVDFGASVTGVRSMNAAQASWKAGNYGSALLHGMQAFGEAGMTVFSFGTGPTLRTGAGMTMEQLAATKATYTAAEVLTFDEGASLLRSTPFIQIGSTSQKIMLTDEYAASQGWLVNSKGGLVTGQYLGTDATQVESAIKQLIQGGFPNKGNNMNVYQHIMGDGADSMFRGATLSPRAASEFATGPGGYGVVLELGPVKGYDAAKIVTDAPRALGSPLISSANTNLFMRADELEIVIRNDISLQSATSAKLFYRDPTNPIAVPRFVRNVNLGH